MEYDIGVRLDMINAKLDHLLEMVEPQEIEEQKK